MSVTARMGAGGLSSAVMLPPAFSRSGTDLEETDANAEESKKTRRPSRPKSPKVKAEDLTRLRAIDDNPQIAADARRRLTALGPRYQILGLFVEAEDKLKLDSLTLSELRALNTTRFRIGINDNTLRSNLTTLQPEYIFKRAGANGDEFVLQLQGRKVFEDAAAKASKSSPVVADSSE